MADRPQVLPLIRRSAIAASPEAMQAARVMVDASRLAQADHPDDVLNGVLDGLALLVEYDAAGVYVIDRQGKRLGFTLVRGCDLPPPDIVAPFAGKGVIGDVLATGQAASVAVHPSDDLSAGRPCARSRLIVPIVGSADRVLGVLDVWSDRLDSFDAQAVDLLALFGAAVAGAIERFRLQVEVVDKRRLDAELALAQQVMDGLLPRATPELPGFDIAGAHDTSREVGGDYYEFIPLVDERWGIVVADVVGKGIAAAILVSAIRASIWSLAGHELSMRAILRRANRFFHESVEEGKFVTLFYAVVDVARREMIYVNAGHMPPVLMRANGTVELLEEGGVPLGLFRAPRYFESHVTLDHGDVLVLYTDGIVEAMNEADDEYGIERLSEFVRQHRTADAQMICSGVMDDVRRHATSRRQDDRTLVVLKATEPPVGLRGYLRDGRSLV